MFKICWSGELNLEKRKTSFFGIWCKTFLFFFLAFQVIVKLSLLASTNQFDAVELETAGRFRERFRVLVMTVVSFSRVDFTFDRGYLLGLFRECERLLLQLKVRHLSDKSQARIEDFFRCVGSPDLLDAVFVEKRYAPTFESMVNGLDTLVEKDRIWPPMVRAPTWNLLLCWTKYYFLKKSLLVTKTICISWLFAIFISLPSVGVIEALLNDNVFQGLPLIWWMHGFLFYSLVFCDLLPHINSTYYLLNFLWIISNNFCSFSTFWNLYHDISVWGIKMVFLMAFRRFMRNIIFGI